MNKEMKEVQRVKGLANLGKLLSKGPTPPAAEPKTSNSERDAIVKKTLDRLGGRVAALHAHCIEAAVREAYNLGMLNSIEQGAAVELLIKEQYDARTTFTMPAVVAAVMEQSGMSTLALELNDVSTVFNRARIEYALAGDADDPIIEYTLHFKSDDQVPA